tara:strand:- start:221 stop:979 length:759 start_codon:yes stop_codon:yes gene_type:complete
MGRLILQEQIERGMLMKFLSIFSARRDASGKTRIAPVTNKINVEEAVRLFGVSSDELTPAVRAAFAAMTGEITELRAQRDALKLALDSAESMADHDPLVPVYNRRAFMRELSRLMSFARRYGLEASLIFFDLDGFKAINDTHGHAAGDKILCAVGDKLMDHTRESDILGRLGGDEFAVVLTSVSPEIARQKAAQLASAISETIVEFEGKSLSVEASYGLTPFLSEASAERLVALADEAMYAQKTRRKSNRAS